MVVDLTPDMYVCNYALASVVEYNNHTNSWCKITSGSSHIFSWCHSTYVGAILILDIVVDTISTVDVEVIIISLDTPIVILSLDVVI